jgi:hypothetical protein
VRDPAAMVPLLAAEFDHAVRQAAEHCTDMGFVVSADNLM